MKFRLPLSFICFVLSLGFCMPAKCADMVDLSPAKKFLDIDVHALVGGSTVMQNYKKSFPEIDNLNINMGFRGGFGARATFGFREYLGLSTELNFVVRNYNMNLVAGAEGTDGITGVQVDNRTYVINVPLAMTLRFMVARNVKWLIDVGVYYSYGFAGRQKQDIFAGTVNALGELITVYEHIKTDYFNSSHTFLNSFHRGDYGIHFGTYLDFGPHLRIGARLQTGIKNTSFSYGVANPSVRNFDFCGTVGYRFKL